MPFVFQVLMLLLLGQTDRDALSDRAQRIVEHPSYQKALAEPDEEDEATRSSFVTGPSVSGDLRAVLLRLLVYLAIAVAACLAVMWLARLWQQRNGKAAVPQLPEAPGEPDPGRLSLAEVERLATSGEYGEAVRALLKLSIAHLCDRRDGGISKALTSRELIRVLPRDGEERKRFKRLVAVTELSLFGGRPVDAGTFRHCLSLFQRIGS